MLFTLADMETELQAARGLLRRAAWRRRRTSRSPNQFLPRWGRASCTAATRAPDKPQRSATT
ncbi:hypothetical protein E3O21_06110 [Cryobacterium flavum]|uniref:Uncharacterized protein n=1 Tax=Cryobacterium flavum TaxID=1424659 RepID=A0ABY2I6G5_9MICO|nr:hypothetical protein E3O21_06110 [Cryobacterium flavum]